MYVCTYIHTHWTTLYLPKHNNSGHLRKATLSLPGTLPCCCCCCCCWLMQQIKLVLQAPAPTLTTSDTQLKWNVTPWRCQGKEGWSKKKGIFFTRVPSYVKCIYHRPCIIIHMLPAAPSEPDVLQAVTYRPGITAFPLVLLPWPPADLCILHLSLRRTLESGMSWREDLDSCHQSFTLHLSGVTYRRTSFVGFEGPIRDAFRKYLDWANCLVPG
jgi:hypothetical protein